MCKIRNHFDAVDPMFSDRLRRVARDVLASVYGYVCARLGQSDGNAPTQSSRCLSLEHFCLSGHSRVPSTKQS